MFPIILQLKKCVSVQLKKLLYLLRYVVDQYETQKMCDEAILENKEILKSVPNCYKNQDMCNKATDNYSHALEFVPECFKTQNMCDKAVKILIFLQ